MLGNRCDPHLSVGDIDHFGREPYEEQTKRPSEPKLRLKDSAMRAEARAVWFGRDTCVTPSHE